MERTALQRHLLRLRWFDRRRPYVEALLGSSALLAVSVALSGVEPGIVAFIPFALGYGWLVMAALAWMFQLKDLSIARRTRQRRALIAAVLLIGIALPAGAALYLMVFGPLDLR